MNKYGADYGPHTEQCKWQPKSVAATPLSSFPPPVILNEVRDLKIPRRYALSGWHLWGSTPSPRNPAQPRHPSEGGGPAFMVQTCHI